MPLTKFLYISTLRTNEKHRLRILLLLLFSQRLQSSSKIGADVIKSVISRNSAKEFLFFYQKELLSGFY